MAYIQEIPKSFDVMDGVLLRCLPGYAPGWVDIEREEVIPGVEVVYHLSQHELGDLGDVRISKADERLTILHVGDPPRVQIDTDELKETRARLKHEHPDWDAARVTVEAHRQEREKADALQRRRKDHHRKVMQAFGSRMADDTAMRVKPASGAREVRQSDGVERWQQIPDHRWHRRALELWWLGHTVPEIGARLFLSPKTVRNRLTELRKAHGEEIVPKADQLRKMKIR